MTSPQMSVAAGSIAAIAHGSARRGACPMLDAPMQTGDGLLARVRVTGRMLTPHQLLELGRLADIHGNGVLEITARGNLQVRGLRAETRVAFAEAVSALLPIDAGLVIDLSPLAGIDATEIADPRPLAQAVADGARAFGDRLGPKVSVVIDGGGQLSLAGIKSDIRLEAATASHWMTSLGGSAPQMLDADAAVATALAALGALAAMGPDARAADLFPSRAPRGAGVVVRQDRWASQYRLTGGSTLPIALPFGSAGSVELMALAETAIEAGVKHLRLAPHHVLLIDDAPVALKERAAELGFITTQGDPRRQVSACVGSQGCASGLIAARDIAQRLAGRVPQGQHLHVSGCPKGCAHPHRAEVTLVGQPGGIGLVIKGRAGDTPQQVLGEAQLADALAHQQGAR